jgi:hypothetical protein
MKFSLVFDNSGDTIPYEVLYNHELFEFFVARSNQQTQNSFSNSGMLYKKLNKKITQLHWSISKINEVLYSLINQSFDQHTNLENYLNQDFLNKTHCDWVGSQSKLIDIDQLRFSSDTELARLGNRLHEQYPDEIRQINTAAALDKLGYLYPYEEVNTAIHGLESSFNKSNLEFSADHKWKVFENPYLDTMISNNDIVNFSFGYTYVGRQYYNKFENFDNDLRYQDHYNYETLEFSFQLNLEKPQTISYSPESLAWAKQHNIKLVTTQLPIANILNLEQNLFEYRKILFRNSRDNNRVKIVLH